MVGVLRGVRAVALACMLAATVAGCASTPVGSADTLEQRAYAIYGTFVIAQESVERLTRPESPLSDTAKLAMIEASQRARPAVDSTVAALESYQRARTEFAAGRAEQGAFDAVVERLGLWVEEARGLVDGFMASVEVYR